MKRCSPPIDLLICLQLEVGLCRELRQVRVLRSHQSVQIREVVVPLLECPFALTHTDMNHEENDLVSPLIMCSLKFRQLHLELNDFLIRGGGC